MVWRPSAEARSWVPAKLTDKELSMIANLPGLADQQLEFRLSMATLRIDKPDQTDAGSQHSSQDKIDSIRGEEEGFVSQHIAPGESFEDHPERVPVVLGKLALLYRTNDQYEKERVLRDPEDFIGQTLELRVGDIWGDLRHTTWDDATGVYRPSTEAEINLEKERVRARLSVDYDLDKYDRVLSIPARVVGIRDGFGASIPLSRAKKIGAWIKQRERESRRLAPAKTEAAGHRLSLLFDTEQAAEAAGIELEAQGFRVVSYHQTVAQSFGRVRIAVWIIGGIVAVMLLLACFLTSSVLARVILDAKREIGLLRALGARQGHILKIYLFEAALLCGLGSLLGILIGNLSAAWIGKVVLDAASEQTSDFWLMGRWVSLHQIDTLPKSLWRFAPSQFLWILAAVGLAMISAYIPARRSSRLDPTEALRLD